MNTAVILRVTEEAGNSTTSFSRCLNEFVLLFCCDISTSSGMRQDDV